jgi:hypothetical protein
LLDLIIYLLISAVILLLVISNIGLAVRRRKLLNMVVQLGIDKTALMEKLSNERNNKDIEQTDGFVRFLSQSRDWAFEYIEDVQQAIQKFSDATGTKDEDEIATAYNKLLEFLPEQEERNK